MSSLPDLPPSAFLVGEKVFLRPLGPEDTPMLSMMANHPETRHALFEFLPMSDRQIARQMEQWDDDPTTIFFAICERVTGRPVGRTGLVRIDWMSRAAIFFVALSDPADWSKGYGGEATRLVCDYAFDTLNLQRIQLHVWSKNERGIQAYRRVGFEVEGTLRRAMYHAGTYEDFLVMARLRPMG